MTAKFKDRPLIIASPPSIFFVCLIAGGILHALFRATLGDFPEMVTISRGVIQPEEAYLEQKFGDEYRTYTAKVRRWL